MKHILSVMMVFLNVSFLMGFNELLNMKLDLIKQFPPGKQWVYLEVDSSFALDSSSQESLIAMGSCLEIKNDRILILDNKNHKLLVFSGNGTFQKAVGKKGRGPGDIMYPYWMDLYKNKIYIKNNNGIDVFGEDLEFTKRVRPFIGIRKFIIVDDWIYCASLGIYKENYPLFLKLSMNGGVKEVVSTQDLQEPLFQVSKEGSLVTLDNQVVFVCKHWNRIYFYDKDTKFLKKIELQYRLLDKIEKWNKRNTKPKKRNVLWFSNMTASAKACNDKIYLLLRIPRLEILGIDKEGNIAEHYYNNKDFPSMIWTDFVVQEKGGRKVFYVMGISGAEKGQEKFLEMNVFRLMPNQIQASSREIVFKRR